MEVYELSVCCVLMIDTNVVQVSHQEFPMQVRLLLPHTENEGSTGVEFGYSVCDMSCILGFTSGFTFHNQMKPFRHTSLSGTRMLRTRR